MFVIAAGLRALPIPLNVDFGVAGAPLKMEDPPSNTSAGLAMTEKIHSTKGNRGTGPACAAFP